MPLYHLGNKNAEQLKSAPFTSERELQRLFEANLESLLGVRFVGSEFTTGDRQRGRIDTLGLDQDGTPTIIEYKKASKENIINQGLFYLDWLVDHKGDFAIAAQKALGSDIEIDWSSPRLILVAEAFSDYDKYAVNRIGANIELWGYRRYAGDLLNLEPVFVAEPGRAAVEPAQAAGKREAEAVGEGEPEAVTYTLADHLDDKSAEVRALFETLRERIFALDREGSVTEKPNKQYVSYKHGKNFCEVRPMAGWLKLWLDIPVDELNDLQGLARDMAKVGHWGTGSVEIKLSDVKEMDYVLSLVEQAYRLTV